MERLEIEIDIRQKGANPAQVQGAVKGLGLSAATTGVAIDTILNPSLATFDALLAAATAPIAVVVAAVAVLVAGLVALGAGLNFSIKEAIEAERVQAQLEAVLRSTGMAAGITADMANDLAMSISELSGISDEAILSAENIMLTFTEIGERVFPEAIQAATDLSVAFGMDLNSASIMLGKALQDPIQGLTALRRVGVSFTDAQAQMIQRMAEGGRIMQAQALIIREVNRQVAGSAEAFGSTVAGEWNKIKNAVSNAGEEIGAVFLPAISGVLSAVNIIATEIGRALRPALAQLNQAFREVGRAFRDPEVTAALRDFGKALAGMVREELPGLLRNMAVNARLFARAIKEDGPAIIRTVEKIADAVIALDRLLGGVTRGPSALGAMGQLATGGGVRGYAGGGVIPRGGVGIVGEREPELAINGPNGVRIIPLSQNSRNSRDFNNYGIQNFMVPSSSSVAAFLENFQAANG